MKYKGEENTQVYGNIVCAFTFFAEYICDFSTQSFVTVKDHLSFSNYFFCLKYYGNFSYYQNHGFYYRPLYEFSSLPHPVLLKLLSKHDALNLFLHVCLHISHMTILTQIYSLVFVIFFSICNFPLLPISPISLIKFYFIISLIFSIASSEINIFFLRHLILF